MRSPVPFTYHYMPVNQWVRRLIAEGYVGGPTTSTSATTPATPPTAPTLAVRPRAGRVGRDRRPGVALDPSRPLAARRQRGLGRRASPRRSWSASRPDGGTYEQAEDSAVLTVRYASGVTGCCRCAQSQGGHAVQPDPPPRGPRRRRHDLRRVRLGHGAEVRGVRRRRWGRRRCCRSPTRSGAACAATTHDTYRDVFRGTDAMTRGWITAIAEQRHVRPDFADGLAVQRVVDAVVASADADGAQVPVTPVAVDRG